MSDFTTEEDAREDPNEVRAIDADERYEVLRCPNPAHGERGAVFIHPLEVRFTWETQFGLAIPGGAVPVRWRGCSQGCLTFLDPPPPSSSEPQQSQDGRAPESGTGAGEGAASVGLDLDLGLGAGAGGPVVDVDMDVDMDVGMADLGGGGGIADPDDFEEAF